MNINSFIPVIPLHPILEQDGNPLSDSINLNLDFQSQSFIDCVTVGGRPKPTFNWYIENEKLNATILASEEETNDNGVILYKSQLQYIANRRHNGQNLRCEVIHMGYTAKQMSDSDNIAKVRLDLQVCNDYGSNQNHGNNTPCGPCLNGYKGDNCDICTSGYYPTSGTNGEVNLRTGEGVKCEGKCYKLLLQLNIMFCKKLFLPLSECQRCNIFGSNEGDGLNWQ